MAYNRSRKKFAVKIFLFCQLLLWAIPAKTLDYRAKTYKHSWEDYPSISGIEAFSGAEFELTAAKIKKQEKVQVTVFIASWCILCQKIVPLLRDIEKKYADKFTAFTYVFAHDLKQDIVGFSSEYGIERPIIIDDRTLHAFHQPNLPSIYVSDRHGWLIKRFSTPKSENLEELEKFLFANNLF